MPKFENPAPHVSAEPSAENRLEGEINAELQKLEVNLAEFGEMVGVAHTKKNEIALNDRVKVWFTEFAHNPTRDKASRITAGAAVATGVWSEGVLEIQRLLSSGNGPGHTTLALLSLALASGAGYLTNTILKDNMARYQQQLEEIAVESEAK